MSDLVYYLSCCVLIAGVLTGIALMSKVESSAKGNMLSSVCIGIAILLTLYKYIILDDMFLWILMAAGITVGLIGAYKVKMIQMPETVALLNGFGGASSAITAVVIMIDGTNINKFSKLTASLALVIGMITLTGSLVAGGKLHKMFPQKPVVWSEHNIITNISALMIAILIFSLTFTPSSGIQLSILITLCILFSGFFGVAFSIRVGGADMPITISLLNSLSGVAGSVAGMAISDPLLICIGSIVGASGLLLTQIMCRAMNRSLLDVLFGKILVTSRSKVSINDVGKNPCTKESEVQCSQAFIEEAVLPKHMEDPVRLLTEAKKVIIIPGYGMALSQAQVFVKQLADMLEKNDTEVLFAIHPVAGRMPGHMNVLLCEADVPYDKLYEIDDINPQFADCDVAIIVGANDVINPAANTAEGTPIYGMPIFEVGKARHIIICNYDLSTGYSGVENPLYKKSHDVSLLLGDAKETLSKLLNEIIHLVS